MRYEKSPILAFFSEIPGWLVKIGIRVSDSVAFGGVREFAFVTSP